jgi:hypothetical protein
MNPMRSPENIHPTTLPNRKSPCETAEEELAARQEAVEAQLKAWRGILPTILAKFARIKDPRRPGSIRHKLTTVLFFGLLLFIFQCTSRRDGNDKLTTQILLKNIQSVFPEIDSIPHMDTVARMLQKVPDEQIEAMLGQLVKKLMKNRKLLSLMVNKRYLVAIDGSQKFTKTIPFAEEALRRKTSDGKVHYLSYVLEAAIVSPQGIVLPLMAEFCENHPDEQNTKQDCELKAFRRLSVRLKELFNKQRLTIVADGLYPNGPIINICRINRWDFMIILPEKCLTSVWDDAVGLHKIESEKDNTSKQNQWGKRVQSFWWANDIIYDWKDAKGHHHHTKLHVVVNEEAYMEKGEKKTATWAWVSSEPITQKNVLTRCNLIGRSRWGIEENLDAEKQHGYAFEHVFSINWNAMMGWHALMRLGHLVNIMTLHSIDLWEIVTTRGISRTLKYLRTPLVSYLMNLSNVTKKQPRLRLVI